MGNELMALYFLILIELMLVTAVMIYGYCRAMNKITAHANMCIDHIVKLVEATFDVVVVEKKAKELESEQMRFEIRSVWGNGERVLKEYSCLKKYNAIIEDDDLFITINSLQDLIDIVKAVGNEIVVTEDELVIYDDYME